jgi:hypothetical protein
MSECPPLTALFTLSAQHITKRHVPLLVKASIQYAARVFGMSRSSLSPSSCTPNTSVMDHVLVILSEIISCEGSSVS